MRPDRDFTFCLYTTTQGHFKIQDRFKTTVGSLQSQLEPHQIPHYLASLKMDPAQNEVAESMIQWLRDKSFTVSAAQGSFSHGQDSHQIEYLKDAARLNNLIKTDYLFWCEDDWIIGGYKGGLWQHIQSAIHLLEDNSDIVQVRIPRYSNEVQRINNLPFKHGINTRAERLNSTFFRTGDWSNNPFIARTRDIRAAFTFVMNSNLPKHSEHGLGAAMKMLGWSELPLAIFDPAVIRCAHIGTRPGDEDDINKELIAN